MAMTREEKILRQKASEALKLVKKGWTKGTMHLRTPAGDDRYCAIGALRAAAGCGIRYNVLKQRLEEIVGMHVVSWNDSPQRRHEDVVDAFRRLAMGYRG